MKQLFAVMLLAFPILLLGQQTTEGYVRYSERIDLHSRLTGERARYKEYIPKYSDNQQELLFNAEASIYRPYIDPNASLQQMQGGGRGSRFGNFRDSRILYQDYETQESIEQREFSGKKYLITGEPVTRTWKVTGESKMILDYPAIKAVLQDTSAEETVAWFAPTIPVPAGPGYGQLPGLILEMTIGDGLRTLRATQVALGPIEETIEAPKRGKEITREEFRSMMRETMKEMRRNRGSRGGGGSIIIRN